MSLAIAGAGSTIAKAFLDIVGPIEPHVHISKVSGLPVDVDRYLICTGYLAGKGVRYLSKIESANTFDLNFTMVAQACDRILDNNPKARICVIGSESGFKGSYDMAYAAAKAGLHLYVEKRLLTSPDQLLVALAPHVIADSAMTERREDHDLLMTRASQNRIGRWLTAREVAEMAHDVLYRWPACTSNQVIRMRP